MAKRHTRVTPGSAAARLARWRWHRNPGGLMLSKKLGGRLLEWHGGQSTALYLVGSRAYGGHPITNPGDIDDALWELNAAYERMLKPADVKHLDATIKMLERESGHQNRNNPRTFASLIRDGDDAVIAVVNRYISTSASLEEAAAKINVAIGGDYKPAEILKFLKRSRGAVYRHNPRGGRKLAASRRRIQSKNKAAYKRALSVVYRRTGLRSMPAVSAGYHPTQATWQKTAQLMRRTSKRKTYARRFSSYQRVAETVGRCNPKRGRRAAQARARIVSRATLRARVNKASGGARNAVMRSILAQVMAGKVKIRGARISAAVVRGIRRGRKNPKRKYVFTRARRAALKRARYIHARGW
jgi:hypothetical protein